MQLLRFGLYAGLLILAGRTSAQQSKVVLPLPEGAAASTQAQADKNAQPKGQVKSTSQLELIDLSGDPLILGYLSTEPENNERTAVVTPIPKEEWLRSALGEDIQKAFANRGVNGLFVINDISAGRQANGNYVRIKGAIYESAAGADSYRLINTIDEVFTDNAGDVKALNSTIAGSLKTSAATISSGIVKTDMKGIAKSEVIKQETEKYTFIGKAAFKTGIYLSYEEFRQQKPAFGQFYLETDAASGKVVVNSFTQTDSTLRPCLNAWGIAVANELYVLQDGVLVPAEAVGYNLVLSKYIDPDVRKNNGVFWRNNVGNRFSTHEAGNPFDNRYVIKLQNYRNKGISGEAVKLNADTGTPEL
jgi:hypothetical protein